ncbi:MAG: SelB C-terminal domain-containing protein, partial [Sphaerochaeta sp.]|nr:SelB C-terminal domain-containing protein [Sphaerochaeta sp.]
RMIEGEAFIRLGPWYLKQSQLEACAQKLASDLDVRHSLPLQTFKQESGLPLELAELVAYHLVEGKQARLVGANLEAAVQQSALSADEEALLKKIEGQGFEGYPVKWIAKEERTTITSLRQKQEILIVEASFVYSERTFAEIVSRILKGKAVGTTFTIADARQHLDLSRKYMIPLLNTLEDRGYVQRMGDVRRVLALPGEKGRTL